MWYVCNVLYAVLYVCVCCFVVCGCAVSRRYVYICYCDMFSVYLDHLKFCVVCVYGRRYACCGECYVVFNECDDPTNCLVQPIVAHCCEVMYFAGCVFSPWLLEILVGYWNAFQWSPTGRVEIKLTIVWLRDHL